MALDLKGAVQQQLGELHLPNSGEAQIQMKIAISQAISKYGRRRFDWNVDEFEFDTVADQYQYTPGVAGELPDDFLRVLGDLIDFDQVAGGGSTSTWAIERAADEDFEALRRDYAASTQQPTHFRDFADRLELAPTPAGAYNIKGRYVKDIGNVAYSWNGSAWSFTAPTSPADDWTSPWLEDADAGMLVRAWSMGLFCEKYLRNSQKAEAYFAMAREAERDELVYQKQKTKPLQSRRYLGGL